MKIYKKKTEDSSKKGAGGDNKHNFSFTRPYYNSGMIKM